MHIGCVIASLGSGGAERVMLSLCAAWAARGDTITLFTFDDGRQDFFEVPTGVTRVALNIAGESSSLLTATCANILRLRTLRQAFRQQPFDLILSFTDRTNVSTLLATRGLGIPVVVSERTDPRHHDIGGWWSRLRQVVYRWASALVVQTDQVRSWAESYVPPVRVHVIGNPLRAVSTLLVPAGVRSDTIAAVGRLASEKGFEDLLRAFALVHQVYPTWRLVVAGDGPLRVPLESQARALGISSAISFLGRTASVEAVLAGSSVFVLSSRYEGFPNVLLEAMACGCACVATDCDSGPSDLLEQGDVGLLAPVGDPIALARAISRLLADPTYRSDLGQAARASAQRYSLTRIVGEWDEVFERVRTRAA